jgi:hypothetical protein
MAVHGWHVSSAVPLPWHIDALWYSPTAQSPNAVHAVQPSAGPVPSHAAASWYVPAGQFPHPTQGTHVASRSPVPALHPAAS